LAVFIAVQNLVAIGIVGLKIYAIFNILRIRLKNAYSRPFWVFWGKNGEKRKTFAVLSLWDAIIRDWHPMNQTA